MSVRPVNDAEAVRLRMELLRGWLGRRLDATALAWLDGELQRIADAPAGIAWARAIGLAPRRVGREPLSPEAAELAAGDALRPGFDASDWTREQAARVLFVLASAAGAMESFPERLDKIARSAEIGEQVALLRGLALYPRQDQLLGLAAEGVRSAIQPVYEAVAHRNPYPADYFTEAMWNQMVVKALFIGSTLTPIQRLDERANLDLAQMLVDYAHERWAAKRPVTPELWRCVGPFATSVGAFDDLLRIFNFGGGEERKGAALALSECPTPEALIALETAPALWRDIRTGKLKWETLA